MGKRKRDATEGPWLVLEPETARVVRTWALAVAPGPRHLAVAPDGGWLAAVGPAGEAWLLRATDEGPRALPLDGPAGCVAFHPTEPWLLVGGDRHGQLWRVDLPEGHVRPLPPLTAADAGRAGAGVAGPVRDLAFDGAAAVLDLGVLGADVEHDDGRFVPVGWDPQAARALGPRPWPGPPAGPAAEPLDDPGRVWAPAWRVRDAAGQAWLTVRTTSPRHDLHQVVAVAAGAWVATSDGRLLMVAPG